MFARNGIVLQNDLALWRAAYEQTFLRDLERLARERSCRRLNVAIGLSRQAELPAPAETRSVCHPAFRPLASRR